YDCGSNIGMSCIYFKRIYPDAKIKAFEADPNIAKVLKENLVNNGFNDIEIIEKAVWKADGEIEFSSEGADGSTMYSDKPKTKIKSIRLKNLLLNEDEIDMLKIDIEGAENEVIIDCKDSLSKVKNIFIEYHSYTNSKQKFSEILRVLEVNNFRYFVNSPLSRRQPLINRHYKSNAAMDLQLNIFGYRHG
ncbi:MAG: FkbM family methyltransferase, partial [Ignavibacterium sp.]